MKLLSDHKIQTNTFSEVGETEGLELYYSFDNLPKFPDNISGTVYSQDAWATVDGWGGNVNSTLSTDNGKLKIVFTGGSSVGTSWGKNNIGVAINDQTLRIRVLSANVITKFSYFNGVTTTDASPTIIVSSYDWVVDVKLIGIGSQYTLYVNYGNTTANTVWVDWIYIGDGSYTSLCRDNSGKGKHGTISGAISSKGVLGRGMYFDGVDDYIQANSDIYTSSFGVTYGAFVNLSSYTADSYNMIISVGNGYPYLGFYQGKPRFAFFDLTNTARYLGADNAVSLNTDYFISASHDGITARLYVNGEVVKETSLYSLRSQTGVFVLSNLRIGNYASNAYPLHGYIDKAMLFSRSFTPNEMKKLYEIMKPY